MPYQSDIYNIGLSNSFITRLANKRYKFRKAFDVSDSFSLRYELLEQ